jgi:hypothetical protein
VKVKRRFRDIGYTRPAKGPMHRPSAWPARPHLQKSNLDPGPKSARVTEMESTDGAGVARTCVSALPSFSGLTRDSRFGGSLPITRPFWNSSSALRGGALFSFAPISAQKKSGCSLHPLLSVPSVTSSESPSGCEILFFLLLSLFSAPLRLERGLQSGRDIALSLFSPAQRRPG